MADYKKNRNIILYSFIGFCVFVIIFILIAPNAPVNPFLIALCFLFGYLTYFQLKAMKISYSKMSSVRLSPRQKRRHELLEKDRGKVIQFPINSIEAHRNFKSKKH